MNNLSGARVLVVDDDEAVRRSSARSVGLLLGLDPEDVLTASSGREAVLLLIKEEAAGRKVDAVLSDFSMPNWDGVQLYDQIEARWPHLAGRFVIQTGDPTNQKVQGLAGRGVTVLEKGRSSNVAQILSEIILKHREGG